MTMMDDERLRGLARVAPLRPARPLAEIRRRSSRLRRARRAGRLAAGGAALTAAALVTQVVVGPGPGGGGPIGSALPFLTGAPANAARADCGVGRADLVRREDVSPALRQLLPADAMGRPLRQAWGRRIRLNCPPLVPAAVLVDFSADHSTARRGLAVWGPEAVLSGDPRVALRVRGRAGQLMTGSAAAGVLSVGWTESDGSRWVVNSSGLSRAQLLAAVDRLRLADGRVARTSLPGGYDETQFPRPVTSGESFVWDAQYGDQPSQPGDDLGVQLAVYQPTGASALTAATLAAPGGVRFVDVNGARAAYSRVAYPPQPTGLGFLEWQTAGGVGFRLSGPLGLADLAALARRLQPVAADDPRLAGVRDGR
jgi:hypothetical protein